MYWDYGPRGMHVIVGKRFKCHGQCYGYPAFVRGLLTDIQFVPETE